MKKNEVQIKKSLGAEAAAGMLEELAASLRQGTVCVEKGSEFVTLKTAEIMDLELRAALKKNKSKLEIELSWRDIVPVDQVETVFKISSEEPEVVEAVEEEAPPAESEAE